MRSSDTGLACGTNGSPQSTIEQNLYASTVSSLEESFANDAFSDSAERMPNCSEAKTPKEKFTKYSLDPDNPRSKGKAEAYRRGLGYIKDNCETLISQIHDAVTSESARPYEIEISAYGAKYKYRIPVTGPDRKTKNVIAVYQIDANGVSPRMTTNYLEGRRMVKEYDMVRTLVTKGDYPKETKGVVVSLYSTGPACEVELWNEDDYPVDVVTYLLDEVEKIEEQ